jgi:single-stranded-DNA-specific exonuclease
MDVSWRIPGAEDPYGLSLEAVEKFAGDYGTLIITVDCGISRVAEIKRAGELSVDVIVTDHHEPQEQLPDALVIIDPKLKPAPESLPYPFKDLSGCGVAFKLVSALRFAQKSELYGQPVCLLNTRPANGAWIVEVAKMRNLAVTATLTETIVPDVVSISDTRLPAFLEGQQILVWDAPLQKRTLAKLFGNGVEVGMLDIAPEIGREIPQVADKSLVRIKELSTVAKYSSGEVSDLDVFVSLFHSFVRKREKIAAGAEESFDLQLVTLGTIGDIMPLLDENRIVIRNGLKSIAQGPRPGIAELLDKLELSGSRFDVKEIAWKVCPAINAARRMGCPEKAAALFFEKDPVMRERLAVELVDMNRQRKLLEEEIWSIAEPMAYRSLAEHHEKLALAYGDAINKGVTGLIAQRIARRFEVPAVAVSFAADVYTGSVRSARGYNIGSLLEQCADLFIDSGGHAFAGGFSLRRENWDALQERLKTAAYAVELDEEREGQTVYIDAELPPEYLTPNLLNLVDRFAPYGKENEPLLFMAKNLVIEDVNFMGKIESKHLRMTLAGEKYKWPAVYWDAAVRVVNKEFGKGDRVDAVFTLSRDWYKGIATPQMMITDLRKSEQ